MAPGIASFALSVLLLSSGFVGGYCIGTQGVLDGLGGVRVYVGVVQLRELLQELEGPCGPMGRIGFGMG
eukprot:scaffold6054_cov42-Attheya_sp.AAC.1